MAHLFILIILSMIPIKQEKEYLPISITESGHILVKAKINGVEGNFIFDTAAGITMLTKNFASKINGIRKLDGSYTAFRATGEKISSSLFSVSQLSLGGMIEKNPVIAIEDVDFGNIDGLISLMTFKNQPFTIDYNKNIIFIETAETLKKREENGLIIPLQLEDSRGIVLDIFAYLKVGGLTLQFLLDSGAGQDVFQINSALMPELNVDISDSSKVKTIQHTSEFNPDFTSSIYKTTIPYLSVENQPTINFSHPNVSFVEGLIYDGKTSINWLGDQLTIDITRRIMIVNK